MRKIILSFCLLSAIILTACNEQDTNIEPTDNDVIIENVDIDINNSISEGEDTQIESILGKLDNEETEIPTMKMRVLDNQSEEEIKEITKSTCENMGGEWNENDGMCAIEDGEIIYF